MRGLALALCVGLIPAATAAQEQEMKVIVDFADLGSIPWTIVNDDVMGGRSTSDLTLTEEGTVFFKGFVSLENNGGFASTRAAFQSLDLSVFSGVSLRVRGDGRRYQIRFRTDGDFDGVAYMAEFDTPIGEWTDISIPFDAFQPTIRGYRPRGVGPLDLARIRQMGFLIGDKRDGPFSLEIAWVKAYKESG